VYADDGYSEAVLADSNGDFVLPGVATGTWTVYASSHTQASYFNLAGSSSPITVTAGAIVPGVDIILDQFGGNTVEIGGTASDGLTPLPGISVLAQGRKSVTDSNGRYMMPFTNLLTSTIDWTLEVNTVDVNPVYISTAVRVAANISVIHTLTRNFDLNKGGKISGRITSNGVDPLPHVPVSALDGTVERGTALTDDTGLF